MKEVMRLKRVSSLFAIIIWLMVGLGAEVLGNPTTVTIPGSFQEELGCPGDWQPDCANTYLSYEAEDDVWQAIFTIPAGAWEYKAALNDSWQENYGLNATPNGSNITLSLAAPTDVKFYYDDKSHWITDNQNAVIATVAGSFQSELGCPGDWQPECLRSWLQDPDGNGSYSFTTTALPAGDYEGKVAINESWDENYGAGGVPDGANIPFSVTNFGDAVTFTYDPVTHILDIEVIPIPPVDDTKLVRPVVEHPFENDILYFAIPDRFADGNTGNNCGDYNQTCVVEDPDNPDEDRVLATGYLPSDKGYYHGGDLQGLQEKLPYLKKMGVTAIWVGPIYKNKTVQSDTTSLFDVSAGYHGYWILDFKQVDPHLGTNQQFKQLVQTAHTQGIKVFMDIVTNHTADVVQLQGNAGYRNKRDFPYLDVNGDPFDDSDFAYYGQPNYNFPPVNENSFPYLPILPPGEENAKNPAWLNNPLLYHNRGDSSFVGENSLYGDFFGLDDLWTERKEVVEGMVDIYKFWIDEFGVDGFRIDTTKHVNMEFWEKFGPDIVAAAKADGIDEFFAFGEVFDQNFGPQFLSEFSTRGQLQSTIDFAFQLAARDFASQNGATDDLKAFFEKDDYYTDADSNAYAQPTFLGNHDMGRIGYFLTQDNPDATDAEILARSQLAHALMYFSRGQPVIYYGDEQGFVGKGGDKDARQDMFPSQVESYNEDDLIGTEATTADANFDHNHPIYRALERYSRIYSQHPALRQGAQIHRYSAAEPGVYAFSRIDRDERVEYLLAFNNSKSDRTVTVPTFYPAETVFQLIASQAPGPLLTQASLAVPGASPSSTDVNRYYLPLIIKADQAETAGGQDQVLKTGPGGNLTLKVPGLGFVIYKANKAVPKPDAAPGITIAGPQSGQTVPVGIQIMDGHEVLERVEVKAQLDKNIPAEVTFAVRVGGGEYEVIGTDNNPPYRVFYPVYHLRDQPNVPLSFRAIVNDLNGHLNSAEVVNVSLDIEEPTGPTLPYAVIHYLRPGGDYGDHTTGNFNDFWGLHLWGDGIDIGEVTNWDTPKPFLGEDEYGRFAWIELSDETLPLNFIVHQGDTKDPVDSPDRSFVPGDNPEIWLKQGDETVYTSQAEAQGYVTIHYECSSCGAVTLDWTSGGSSSTGLAPDGVDSFGAFFIVEPPDFSQPLNVTLKDNGVTDIDNQSVTPTETASAWFRTGDQTVYPSRGAAEGFAIIHYRRPAGDYGDPSSSDFNDFWGLHTFLGAPDPGWTTPRKPAGADLFGIFFRVDYDPGAESFGYIFHRGDTKDPGPDQFLLFSKYGHEVWQLQGADPENPYVAPPTSN